MTQINFEYKEILYKGNRLAYFRLFNNDKSPYLFKKEYKDTQPKGSHYRIGTGFVRSGSSTRELRRDDFEKMYADRSATKDRSNDIDFEFSLGGFKSLELRYADYIKYLRVDATNLSNTSIDLDVEAKIYNNKHVNARYAQDEESKLYDKSRDKSMFAYTPYLDKMMPPIVLTDTNVQYENYTDYSTYEIIPKKGTHTALRVKQKGTQTDIFNGQIALVFSRPAEIKIDLIVRSIDFPHGPKTFSYVFVGRPD